MDGLSHFSEGYDASASRHVGQDEASNCDKMLWQQALVRHGGSKLFSTFRRI